MIYLIVFALSIMCVYTACKNQGKKRMFFFFLAVLIPSLLAAFRTEAIGTDTSFYVKNSFYNAKFYHSFWTYNHYYSMEFLYNLLVYIAQKMTGNIQYLYFFFEVVILGFTLGACYHERDKVPMHYSYGFFLLLYYNRSLNMVRQTLALSVVLYAFHFIREKKLFKYLLFVYIASLFHSTAIFAVIAYPLSRFISGKNGALYKFFILGFSIMFLLGYQEIIMLLIKQQILPAKYIYYTNSEGVFVILIEFFRKFVFLVLFFLFSKSLKRLNKENSIFIFYMALDFVLYCISFKATYAQRISYYFGYFDIFLIPQLILCTNGKLSKRTMKMILIVGFVVYWFIYYCVLKYDQTYPYISIFH